MSSIVFSLVAMGLVNVFKYLDQANTIAQDKYAMNSIMKYVHQELFEATRIYISKEVPDNGLWEYISIEEGNLIHKTSDKPPKNVFNKEFYQNRFLKMQVQSEDSKILSIEYNFINYHQEKIYASKDTMLNYFSAEMQNENINNFDTLASQIDIQNDIKVYFQKQEVDHFDNPDDFTGTVADQIKCKSEENDYKLFYPRVYHTGDFIFLKNSEGKDIYYRCLQDGYYQESDINNAYALKFKKIDAYHDPNSAYLPNDIVLKAATNKYYQCIKTTQNLGIKIYLNNTLYWKNIEKPTSSNALCEITKVKGG